MKVLIFMITLIYAYAVMSCEVSRPKFINIASSLEDKRSFYYRDDQYITKMPVLRAVNCQQEAIQRNFLMIAVGPETNEFTDRNPGYSYNNDYYESSCKFKNAPVKTMSFDEKVKIFKNKSNIINKCLNIIVQDEGRAPIRFPKNQPGCKVERLSSDIARFSGGFCYFNINMTSSFAINFEINKKCESIEGLKELGLSPEAIKGQLNFYSSGDASGNSNQLKPLSTTDLNYTINASPDFMKTAFQYSENHPKFSSTWSVKNIHPGKIYFEYLSQKKIKIFTPLFVDNNCSKTCKDGICMGPCSMNQPVAADISLFEIKDKKKEYLTSWYEGGVAQTSYQGLINGMGFDLPIQLIEDNKEYEVEMIFNDPKYDFEMFKKSIVRKFGLLEQHLPQMPRSGLGVGSIPNINEIIESGLFPFISDIGSISFEGNALDAVARASNQLREYLNYKHWPPYFDRTCSGDLKKCRSVKDNYLKITQRFKVQKNDDGSFIPFKATNESYEVENYINNTTYKSNKIIEIDCKY